MSFLQTTCILVTNLACRPTDAAIQAFLKDMGLTAADLKSRPGLAKKLVAVHAIIAGA
jgi:hypothetical protein